MPTPVAHSCLGLSIGLAYVLPRGSWTDLYAAIRRQAGFLLFAVVVSNVPDVDYLPGLVVGRLNAYHHFLTHTIGWTTLVAAGLFLCWRAFDERVGWREFGFLWLVLVSHLMADWLTDDGRPPYGIMMGWPFTDRFMISPVTIFPRSKKLTVSELWCWHNVGVALWESLVGMALTAGVVLFFHTRTHTHTRKDASTSMSKSVRE